MGFPRVSPTGRRIHIRRSVVWLAPELVRRLEADELEVEGIEIALLEFGDTSLDGIANGFNPLERQGLGRVNLAGNVGTVEEFALGEVEAVPRAPNEVIEVDLRCGHSSSLCAKKGSRINPKFLLLL